MGIARGALAMGFQREQTVVEAELDVLLLDAGQIDGDAEFLVAFPDIEGGPASEGGSVSA